MNSKQIDRLIESFCELVPNAWRNIAHVVLEDYNLQDSYLKQTIKVIGMYFAKDDFPSRQELSRMEAYRHSVESGEITELDLKLTKAFLELLLLIPENLRDMHGEENE